MPDFAAPEMTRDWLADDCLALVFSNAKRDDHLAKVHGLYHALRAALPGMEDVVPAYDSVTLKFDPLAVSIAEIEQVLDTIEVRSEGELTGTVHTIKVEYGGEAGPDFHPVCAANNLTPDRFISLHSGREYAVAFLGFTPGFAYLGQTHERLHIPRRGAPRTSVPSGSVGLAGWQTGIYGRAGPGGWQIIGRAKTGGLSFAPGDTLKFVQS